MYTTTEKETLIRDYDFKLAQRLLIFHNKYLSLLGFLFVANILIGSSDADKSFISASSNLICEDVSIVCGWDWQSEAPVPVAYGIYSGLDVIINNVQDNTNDCGVGLLLVEYCVEGTDVCCTQTITMTDPGSEFDPDAISFQNNQTIVCNDIPNATQPVWGEGMCDLVGWTYEDVDLWFEDGACRKVIRTYTVSNWCTGETAIHHTFLTVIDNEPAVFGGENEMFVVDNSTDVNPQDCEHDNVILTMTGFDTLSNCNSEWLEWKVEVDLWGDGTIDKIFAYAEGADEGFNPSSDNDQDNIMFLPKTANGAVVSINLGPVANSCNTHQVVWTLNDGCNNISSLTESFMVVDQKPPTPYCLSVSSAIMPPKSSVELWVSDFDIGSYDLCNDVLISFSDSEILPNMNFTCDMDADGDGVISVPIYYWDLTDCYANIESCNVELSLSGCFPMQQNLRMIAGEVLTELGKQVEDVEMIIDSDHIINYPSENITDANGNFAFPDNIETYDYKIQGQKNDDHMNGVSTLDLVLIQKHILLTQPLDSPYKMIAADVNNSQTITAMDLIELRKLILGIYTELPNNASWRMGMKNQSLTSANPWMFTEFINIEELAQDEMNVDFVGVKIGDVNGSVVANATSISTENRSNGSLTLEVMDRELKAGQTVNVEFMSDDYTNVYGYQFTMNFDGASVSGITGASNDVTSANIAVSDKSMAMSYHSNDAQNVSSNEVLFTLELTALKDGKLSEMMSINSSITRAEAYVGEGLDIVNVDLGVRNDGDVEILAAYELYQNEPNPFNGVTQIGFSLPEAASATMTIYDVTGKVIRTMSNDYQKGYNTIRITKADLAATSGVLYYQLESGDFVATRKMIVIE